ncbi:MAG TPA: 50S ribosomal protein L19 [Candidatus Moranbacteria bacterium]|nr:MAG: 50S ribosomal protein L19 [Parcubacteria group bacterium GW2011_GWC1_45_14]HAV11171.1 50S ribosomal protein L19 [Candidatus Moranbacteria bacterium]
MVEFNMTQRTSQVPDLQTGDVVKVYRKIVEGGKERIQMFQGMIIATRGGQSSSPTITVRKVSNGVGVELVLPVHSPMIEKIELVKKAKTRRSKLYYIREKTAKSLKLKYKDIAEFAAVEEAPVVEEVAASSEKAEEAVAGPVVEEKKAEEIK